MSMTLDGFRDLLDLYGSQKRQWPAHLRQPCQDLLLSSAEAREALAQTRAFEDALRSSDKIKAPVGLLDRICSAVSETAAPDDVFGSPAIPRNDSPQKETPKGSKAGAAPRTESKSRQSTLSSPTTPKKFEQQKLERRDGSTISAMDLCHGHPHAPPMRYASGPKPSHSKTTGSTSQWPLARPVTPPANGGRVSYNGQDDYRGTPFYCATADARTRTYPQDSNQPWTDIALFALSAASFITFLS